MAKTRSDATSLRITDGTGKPYARWTQIVKRFADQTQKQYMAKSRAVDRDLLGFLIGDYEGEYGTPVRTGRAFSSWRLNLNKPVYFDRGKEFSGTKKQHFDWERSFLKYKTKLNDKVYITNGAPYIEKLEFGASQQNKYFIEKAINRVRAKHK